MHDANPSTTFVLNADDAGEGDRAGFVQEALGATVVPIDMHWIERSDGVRARGTVTGLGDLTICSGRTSAWKVDRTPRRARDDLEPSVFVNLQHSGSGVVVQHGREAVIRPGHLVMYDTTSPYTLLDEDGVSGDFLRVPRAALRLPPDMIRRACAVDLSPGHPVTALTSRYLRRLAADPDLPDAADAALIARPTIEMIRALVLIHLRAEDAAEPAADGLRLRILEYAREHLHDPGLSAEQIAAATFVSVRQLYKVLAAGGIGLAEWIRVHRLDACREELAYASRSTTVAAIARRHGFSDMSSFSRSFRAAYGMTPREWRVHCAAQAQNAAPDAQHRR